MSKENIVYLWIKIPDIVFHLVEKNYSHALERLYTWYKHHEKDDPILSRLELILFERLEKTPTEIFSLLMEIKEKRVRSSTILDIDQKIKNILKQNFLLQNVSLELAQKLKRVIIFILKDNMALACKCFLNIPQTMEISDQDMETYLMLGQNLFAAAQKPVDFIYYKKLTIAYLLEQSHYERAKKQLDDFDQKLPQDKNFAAFREILCQWRAEKPT